MGGRFFGGLTMLTTMTEEDWTIILRVFEASRSRRGDKGRDDKKFPSALRYFAVHNTKVLYNGRARIEQAVGKLKRFKRIALRCEKTARNCGSFAAFALGFILIKSVHMAQR
jgi:hypothetical protein